MWSLNWPLVLAKPPRLSHSHSSSQKSISNLVKKISDVDFSKDMFSWWVRFDGVSFNKAVSSVFGMRDLQHSSEWVSLTLRLFCKKMCSCISSISSVIRSWLDHQPFFFFSSIHKKNGPHRLCSRRQLHCPGRNEILTEEHPEKKQTNKKKHIGCTLNESWLLELLHSDGFGGRWCWCGALGRMECFNGNAETCAVKGKYFSVPTSPFWRSLHALGCDKIPNDNNQGIVCVETMPNVF